MIAEALSDRALSIDARLAEEFDGIALHDFRPLGNGPFDATTTVIFNERKGDTGERLGIESFRESELAEWLRTLRRIKLQ